ncbi:MAG: hypothetical protein GW788_06020 [Ignavibacteria bacterium]|jgi:hypothetical protein|nr:hypothetical protein [Ignavibacteria bacterium]
MCQYITEKLNETELVYGINVWDVQTLAKERIGRELNFSEMNSVKKGMEWGFFDWFEVVNIAIDSAIEKNIDKKLNERF